MVNKVLWMRGWCGLVAVLILSGCGAREVVQRAEKDPAGEDAAFIETLERDTFRWFWEATPAATGLTPDRAPTRSFSSIAAVGFALTAYGVGAERGYVTREEAAERALTTLRNFWTLPQGTDPSRMAGYKGFFFHFLEPETGTRFKNTELSTIDTALLMAGVLFAQSYFDGQGAREVAIRAYADSLYRRVEWPYFQTESPLMTMAWYPDRGFSSHAYRGYDEAMILYLLALGSPTHPVGPEAWSTFTSTYRWEPFYGYEHVNFAPLFGHQYSHVWVDFRGIQDAYMSEKGIDYFENARRATLSQKAYAVDNPRGFSEYGRFWGLTASDGPANVMLPVNGDSVRFQTYWARGAAAGDIRDDGTIAPTAAGGSIAFAPDEAVPMLRSIKEAYGDDVYNQYGFVDAFNPTFQFTGRDLGHGHVTPGVGWFDHDQLGIDQGPIVLMIENQRTGLVWETMKTNPYIVQGLCRAGFTGGWLEGRCS